ncbi:MAG: Fic family protein [Rhodocyclaceae bacterium]|nr:Fic family protein [Rhodocyclaceae bacterium]
MLKNLAGVRGKRAMDALEAVRLAEATDWAIRHYTVDHRFTAKDVCRMHRQWLGVVYPWAGRYRQVNIGKGGFAFATAAQVPRLMDEFERDVLGRHTPCGFEDRDRVIEALAVTHGELVLIHPFREGNGRVSRLLATLMALQAGLPLLDFSGITGKARQAYFLAVQAGMRRDYEPMKRVFRAVLRRSGA